ncbi:MAG: universal stress protein [Halobacteriaceae archaeon]
MYADILVPTDGSDAADRPASEAVELARRFDATVHALYVVDVQDYSTVPETTWAPLVEDLEAAGEIAVEAVADVAADAGVPVQTAVRRGLAHQTIREYADETGADLIVMGTHGRSGLNRFLLGSVTEKVIRGADVPVLVIQVGEHATASSPVDGEGDQAESGGKPDGASAGPSDEDG